MLPNTLLPARRPPGASPALLDDGAPSRRRRVACIPDLPYNDAAPAAHAKQRLDLYLPVDDGAPLPSSVLRSVLLRPASVPPIDAPAAAGERPIVIFIHGGGWKRFGRKSHANVGRAFASRGYVTAVISYRLSSVSVSDLAIINLPICLVVGCITVGLLGVGTPAARGSVAAAFLAPLAASVLYHAAWFVISGCRRVRHPAHVEDAALAMRWLAAHAAAAGGDPARLLIVGHSAGGHIASLLAVAPERWLAPTLPDGRARVRAAALLSGVYSAQKLARHGTPREGAAEAALIRAVVAARGGGLSAADRCGCGGGSGSAGGGECADAAAAARGWPPPPVSPVPPPASPPPPPSAARRLASWTFGPAGGAFRRAWFLRPAFGADAAAWPAAFVCGESVEAGVAALRSAPAPPPPLLLVNAAHDVGLSAHTDLFQAQLLAAGAPCVERVTLRGTNHASYVLGMGRAGFAGEDVAVPAIVDFFRRHGCGPPA